MLERFARRRAGRNHKANKELALSRLRASTTRYEPGRPIGTRQRMWLDVLAYTGLRRGDAAVLGRQHVRNGIARIKTEKTLPILPVLQRTLDAGPCGDLTSIVGANGKPLTKERFGNLLCKACNTAGVPGSAYGIAKLRRQGSRERGDGCRTRSHLWLARRWQGIALHEEGPWRAACPRGNVQAGERKSNVPDHEVRVLEPKGK